MRTKAQKDFDDTVNDPEKMAVALADATAEGDWRLFFIRRDRWRTLTPADVTRVGAAWLKPSNLTIGMFLPEAKPDRAPVVAAVDIPALVNNYKGDPPSRPAKRSTRRLRTSRRGPSGCNFPNGMKVALLPKKTRGETAEIELRLDIGDTDSLRNSSPASGFTAAMLERGTAKHDRQAFADALDKLRTKLNIAGSGATVAVEATTVRGSVPDVLRLAAEALREPAFVPSEFEQLKRERLTALEQSRSDPTAIARRAAARAGNPYPPDDVRYTPTIDEEIQRVRATDVAAAKAFHAKFYGASHAELAIVGDFDAAAVKPLIRELFGDYASPTPYARVPQPLYPTKAAPQTFETPDKANAAMFGRLSMPLNDESADYAALTVANRILGGDSDSRIFKRVRVTEGLSYGVGSVFQPASIDLEQHVRRLRDLRAAESREGPRRNSAGSLARAAKAVSPSRKLRRRKRRCWKSAAFHARRTTRWRARSCRRHSSAGRGPSRRKSMRPSPRCRSTPRTRRCASMSIRRESRTRMPAISRRRSNGGRASGRALRRRDSRTIFASASKIPGVLARHGALAVTGEGMNGALRPPASSTITSAPIASQIDNCSSMKPSRRPHATCASCNAPDPKLRIETPSTIIRRRISR